MSASYKPALLVAIVRCVDAGRIHDETISLRAMAEEYLTMYWSQVVIYRLRHSRRDAAPPVIVQAILNTSNRERTRRLDELSAPARTELVGVIERVLPINVLKAFHVSKPIGSAELFTWQKGWGEVTLTKDAVVFIRANGPVLTLIANYYWARFLARLNAAPYIVDKLERLVPRRSSLDTFARHLIELGESTCFYCNKRITEPGDMQVDHFIPWTFVFEDKLWNLVISCQRCNSSKSDALASEEALARLISQNKIRTSSPSAKVVSMLSLQRGGADLARLYELALQERWPVWAGAPSS